MTTQTVLLDLFDYGASPVTVTVHDPDTMTLTDTADTVTQNGVNGCRYAAVFTRVSVLAGGLYAVGVEVNGIPGILYCTLAGTDGETVVARAERASVLDSATQTQIDEIQDAVDALGAASSGVVERSVSDTNAITFAWPVSGATITGTRSLNNGSYAAVDGAITFLRTETGKHYYTLAFDADDRPSVEGQVRYKFVDGTYTRYVVLRVEPDLTPAQVNAQVLDVLSVDTFSELTAPPAATSSLKDKITWLFMYARNKVTQTALARTLYRDDTTTVAGTSTTSDNGTTFTKGEDA
jgi:hypothetical protein